MNSEPIKMAWKELYTIAPMKLKAMQDITGLASGFNSNIDAVKKISGKQIENLIFEKLNMHPSDFDDIERKLKYKIEMPEDFIRAIFYCFTEGEEDEWLVKNSTANQWIEDNIGYDRVQMGGQAGIISNLMAVCGVKKVYNHCISHSQLQSEQFVNLDNLYGVNQKNELQNICNIINEKAENLIHFIIEFEKGDVIQFPGTEKKYVCPRSNRFIATYDIKNFDLTIDENFSNKMKDKDIPLEFVLLSGYQLMSEKLTDSIHDGVTQMNYSFEQIQEWKNNHPNLWVHLEFAATRDKVIWKHLCSDLCKQVDSLGLNDMELIEVLDIMNQFELKKLCQKQKNILPRFQAIKWLFEYTRVKRVMLHQLGLFLTICRLPDYKLSPEEVRDGMILASTIAASKAGTGNINTFDNLLWAHGKLIHDISETELVRLSNEFGENAEQFLETGIYMNEDEKYFVVAVPTILVEKPKTLVGMGDTISSIGLVGAGRHNK